jgi:hypothetical protein
VELMGYFTVLALLDALGRKLMLGGRYLELDI